MADPKAPTTAELQDLHDTAMASVRGVRFPGATAEELVRATCADTIARWALPLAKQRDVLAAESARRGELLAAERERYVALQRTLDNERHAAADKSSRLFAAEAVIDQLRTEITNAHEMLDGLGEDACLRADTLARRIDSLDTHVDTVARAEERALMATKVEACAAALEAESLTDKGVRGAALREAAAMVRAMVR